MLLCCSTDISGTSLSVKALHVEVQELQQAPEPSSNLLHVLLFSFHPTFYLFRSAVSCPPSMCFALQPPSRLLCVLFPFSLYFDLQFPYQLLCVLFYSLLPIFHVFCSTVSIPPSLWFAVQPPSNLLCVLFCSFHPAFYGLLCSLLYTYVYVYSIMTRFYVVYLERHLHPR